MTDNSFLNKKMNIVKYSFFYSFPKFYFPYVTDIDCFAPFLHRCTYMTTVMVYESLLSVCKNFENVCVSIVYCIMLMIMPVNYY